MSNQAFKRDFAKLLARAGDKVDLVVRKTALTLQSSMIEKSPVGNPSLWKDPSAAPPGYTGGRFRANWQAGLSAVNTDTSAQPGADAEGRTRVVLAGWKPGQTIFLTNSLPYSKKIEHGHSTQAPVGVVKLTVQDFHEAVAKAAREIR